MEALIRSAQLAAVRTRLSETRIGDPSRSQSSRLREEIEQAVRAEFASQMQSLYTSERSRAHADGYAEGLAQARAEATGELERLREQLSARLDSALQAMEQAHQRALAKLETSVGEVAFAAVCRLVGSKAASREFVLGLVEHACTQLRTDAVATARLHPRDIDTLRELLQGDQIRINALGLRLLADESLQLGGCVIEAASGQYDGGLEAQLCRLHAVLTAGTEPDRGMEG